LIGHLFQRNKEGEQHGIDQIDTELPLDKQLEESKAIADTVFEVAKTKVDAQIDDMLID